MPTKRNTMLTISRYQDASYIFRGCQVKRRRNEVCTALESERYMKTHRSNKKDNVEVPRQTITCTCNISVIKNRKE